MSKIVEYDSKPYFYVEALSNGMSVSFSKDGLQYSINNGRTWNNLSANTDTPEIDRNEKIYFRGELTSSISGIGHFSMSANCNVGGNIMSLLFGKDFEDQKSLSDYNYAFYHLFEAESNLKSAGNLILPATRLSRGCYNEMFYHCSLLTTPPALPATELEDYCYDGMFYMCTDLSTAPSLPATELAGNCYRDMFYYCYNLESAPVLPAEDLEYGCYDSMFKYCSSLKYIKMLATDISASDCLSDWVYGVYRSGTFVKSKDADGDVVGDDGVPENWNISYA